MTRLSRALLARQLQSRLTTQGAAPRHQTIALSARSSLLTGRSFAGSNDRTRRRGEGVVYVTPQVLCASKLPNFLARWRVRRRPAVRGPAGTGSVGDGARFWRAKSKSVFGEVLQPRSGRCAAAHVPKTPTHSRQPQGDAGWGPAAGVKRASAFAARAEYGKGLRVCVPTVFCPSGAPSFLAWRLLGRPTVRGRAGHRVGDVTSRGAGANFWPRGNPEASGVGQTRKRVCGDVGEGTGCTGGNLV